MSSQKGSSLIETLFLLLAVGASLAMGFITIYLGSARVWLEHSTYEGALCLAQGIQKPLCEREISDRLIRVFPFGKIKNIDLTIAQGSYMASTTWNPLPKISGYSESAFGLRSRVSIDRSLNAQKTHSDLKITNSRATPLGQSL